MDQGSELVAQNIPTARFSRLEIINVLPKEPAALAMCRSMPRICAAISCSLQRHVLC
jgi:hypothetical protein